MYQDIHERVMRVLKENIENPEMLDTIKPENELTKFEINSITFIKIVIALEKEFDIEFEDEDLEVEKFKSINDIVQGLAAKIGQPLA